MNLDEAKKILEDERLKITNEDRGSILYFTTERWPITRWCDWEKRKDAVRQAYPELIASLDRLETENRTLQAILDKVSNDMYEEITFFI